MIACALFVAPAHVLAHATPVTYTPDAGVTELSTPSSISIRFTERIEVGASSLTVYGPQEQTVNVGKGTLDESDERVFSVPITDAGEGVYTVSWQVVSVDDGHFTKGAFSFLVDATGKTFEGDAGGVEISYSSKLPEAVLDFLKLIGESIFLASLLFLVCIFTPLHRKRNQLLEELQDTLSAVFTHLVTIAFLLLSFGGVCIIVQKSLELASLQSISFAEALSIYLRSSVGTFLALTLVMSGLFFLIWIVFRKRLFVSPSPVVLATLGVIIIGIMYLQSEISHAAASLFLPNLSVFVTFVHLAAKEFMVGGVCLLLVLFLVLVRHKRMGFYPVLAARFDLYASIALFFAGISGAYISWLHLKHANNLVATQWGVLFIILLLATCAFGASRLLHQFVVHPRMGNSVSMRKLLSITLPCEVAIALLVLFYSGYISITTPPFIVEQYGYEETIQSEDIAITLRVHPYEHEAFKIEFADTQTGETIDPQALTVLAYNPEKNIGPNVLQTEKRHIGGYVFLRNDLTPSGPWEITVIADRPEGYDAHAEFEVQYPDDVEASMWSDDIRHFDVLAKVMLAISLVIILGTFGLYMHARIQVRKQDVQLPETEFDTGVPLWKTAIASLLLAVVVFGAIALAFILFGQSEFQRLCEADGHQWRQAFPARDFSKTAPNALNGCAVHDGHFHFVDEREYRYYKAQQ